MIFFELLRWGDFDMSYTDSVWYKENATDEELMFHKRGILLTKMIVEFRKLSGKEFKTDKSYNISLYCDKKETQVLQAFKEYLKSRGYKAVETIKVQFTDENLSDMGIDEEIFGDLP